MNQIGRFALVCACATTFLNCEPKTPEAEKKMYEEVMKVHDDVMPKMGEVNQIKQNIQAFNNILKSDDAATILKKDSLISTALLLLDADESMFQWMDAFNYPQTKRSDTENLAYLTAQKDSVNELSNKIYLAIGMGYKMLKTAPDSLRLEPK